MMMICEALLVTLIAAQDAAPAQATARAQAAAPAPRPYAVTVSDKDGLIEVAVDAKDAKLADVAVELSKRLRARVVLGQSLEQETITVTAPASALEQALASLAPRALVDYEIRQNARPAPMIIYLLGLNDADPPVETVARGMSHGLLIEGNTEDAPTKAPAEDPLQVTGDKNLLSIVSKKQPLNVVAMAISDVIGVPVDLRYDAGELVDLDVRNARPEDIIPRISPNVRLYMRVDAQRLEHTLIRIVVAPPSAALR
jgi:hypothetical protein